jgi:hypothetical protein
MTAASDDPRARLRRGVYLLLAVVAAGMMLGRILAVDSVDRAAVANYRLAKELAQAKKKLQKMGLKGQPYKDALKREEKQLRERLGPVSRPFLSANDRSRLCAVRALVEEDMRVYEVTDDGSRRLVPYAIDKVIQQPDWDTIDMVKHDGHYYSSKPPLLSTLLSGEYWLIYRLTGMSLGSHPFVVGRIMLVTVNVIPLLVYFWLLARLVERFGGSDWGRLFVMAAAAFGTFLTTFAVAINNHLPAAVCAVAAVYPAARIWFDARRGWRYFALAGLFAALAAANELPALSLLAMLTVGLLWRAPARTLLCYLPPALLVVAGFFATNWIAHNDLRPPYLHRGQTDPADNWYHYTYMRDGVQRDSYWSNPQGLDKGEPSPWVYALHVLVGHHGIFSLTPIWLMAVGGMLVWLWRGDGPEAPGRSRLNLRPLAVLIATVTLACLVFYLTRPQDYRNYSGASCGFRWMFWLAPLWLLCVLPAADWMARRWWTRWIALLLLAASVLSASYPTWNPWTHPWLMDYLQYLGWIG